MTNNQGLTLGQQVGNYNQTSNAYQTRTQRQNEQDRITSQYNDLKNQASQIASGITSFEQYKSTYASLSPQLKQFFKAPEDIQQEQNVQQQKDMDSLNQKADTLRSRVSELQKQKDAYTMSSIGSDLATRNAQLRQYELDINQTSNELNYLLQNQSKISEGYSLGSIEDYASQKAMQDIDKLQQPIATPINFIENQYGKIYFDASGKPTYIESKAFQKTMTIDAYNKAVDQNNKIVDDYNNQTAKLQSVDPASLFKPGKAFNPNQPYIPTAKEYTIKDIGAPNVLPTKNVDILHFDVNSKIGENPFWTETKTPEQYAKQYEGKISAEAYLNYKYMQTLQNIADATGFSKAVRGTESFVGSMIGKSGDDVESFILTNPYVPFPKMDFSTTSRLALFSPAFESTFNTEKNLGVLVPKDAMSEGIVNIRNPDADISKVDYTIKTQAGDRTVLNKGEQFVKGSSDSDAYIGKGTNEVIEKINADTARTTRNAVVSASKEMGTVSAYTKIDETNAMVFQDETGAVGATSRSLTKQTGMTTDVKMPGVNNFMRVIQQETIDAIKEAIPKQQDMIFSIKPTETPNRFIAEGTKMSNAEIEYYPTGKFNFKDGSLTEEYIKKAKVLKTDINVRLYINVIKEAEEAFARGSEAQSGFTFEKIGEGAEMTVDEIESAINQKKTPLSVTFPKEEPKTAVANIERSSNIEAKIKKILYPDSSLTKNGFADSSTTMDEIVGKTHDQIMDKTSLKQAIKAINAVKIEEPTPLKAKIMQRGQVWSAFDEKSSFGTGIKEKTNLPSNVKSSMFPPSVREKIDNLLGVGFKDNTQQRDRQSQKSDQALMNQLKSELKLKMDNKFDTAMDVLLDQMSALKFRQPLIEEQLMKDSELSRVGFSFEGRIPKGINIDTGFKEQKKQKIKKKIRQIKDTELFADMPDFTSRQLDLQPEKVAMKDVNRALRNIKTGFEIRRGITIK